jgi:2-dehydro-3-deoxyphosphooctonate aldolase (KDO 8-P synthase)
MSRFLIIAGPCVMEPGGHPLRMAEKLKQVLAKYPVDWIFKASFDKANRTAITSYRGPGLEKGLEELAAVKDKLGVRLLTDIHETAQAAPAAKVVDILQIPAFLCRQTDLLVAAGRTGRAVNIKKGQFMAPDDMKYAVEKVKSAGSDEVSVTERGAAYGYHDLVVDMRSLLMLRETGAKVIYDATHSLQQPGGAGGASGGLRQYVLPLARAAAAVGIDGLFVEVHDDPARAMSDRDTQLPLGDLPALLDSVLAVREAAAGA